MPHKLVNRSIPKPEASHIATARAVLEEVYLCVDAQAIRRHHRMIDKQKFAEDAARIATRRPKEQDDTLDKKKRRITVRLMSGEEIELPVYPVWSTLRDLHKEVRCQLGVPTNATSISMRLTFESGVKPHSQNFRKGQEILADDTKCYCRRSKGCLLGCTLACLLY